MEYGLELQAIQRNNSILYPYKIQKNLTLYFDEYRNVELEYLKHKNSSIRIKIRYCYMMNILKDYRIVKVVY